MRQALSTSRRLDLRARIRGSSFRSAARLVVVAAAVTLLAGCASDDALDPTGTWSTTVTFGAGDCGFTGTLQDIWTVTKSANGYAISSSDPNQTLSGTFTCDSDSCELSAQVIETGTLTDGTPFTGNIAYNYSLTTDDKIAGSGSASVSPQGGSTCTQAFTASGSRT
jgi:hypothetical protein